MSERSIVVYDNFLPQDYFNHLSGVVMNEQEMPWFFSNSVAGINCENEKYDPTLQYGFCHILFNDAPNSFLFNEFYDIIEIMKKTYHIDIFNLKRMRLGMQVKINNESIVNFPHIDFDQPHKVLLLYLNDADGDTIFYNNNQEFETISPAPNRAVMFDGNILHSSSTPTKNERRIALNINFNLMERN